MRAHRFFIRAHMERGRFGAVARLGGGAYLAIHAAASYPTPVAVETVHFTPHLQRSALSPVAQSVQTAACRTFIRVWCHILTVFSSGIRHERQEANTPGTSRF